MYFPNWRQKYKDIYLELNNTEYCDTADDLARALTVLDGGRREAICIVKMYS